MATYKTAKTAREVFEKYKSKRYNAENAGLCEILDYIFITFRARASAEDAADLPERLYTPERQDAILRKAYYEGNERGVNLIVSMESLVGWLATARDSAWSELLSARININTAMSHLEALSIIARQPQRDTLTELEEHILASFITSRECIANALCYVHGYNTFIEMTGRRLSIPEFSLAYSLYTDDTESLLQKLNEKTREIISKDNREAARINDIGIVPTELPEENLRRTDRYITSAYFNIEQWSVPLTQINKGYWRRTLPNG